jgi:hypothetical protein
MPKVCPPEREVACQPVALIWIFARYCSREKHLRGEKNVKKLTIKSLATTGAFVLLLATGLVSSLAACGEPAQRSSSSGVGSASHASAPSGADELQRWQTRMSAAQGGDELQRWNAKVPVAQDSDELQRWQAKSADAQP